MSKYDPVAQASGLQVWIGDLPTCIHLAWTDAFGLPLKQVVQVLQPDELDLDDLGEIVKRALVRQMRHRLREGH